MSVFNGLFGKIKNALQADLRDILLDLSTGNVDRDFAVKTVTTKSLKLDLSGTNALAKGEMGWNPTEEVPEFRLNGAVGQMFLEMYFHAKNETGSEVVDGTPIMGAGVTDPDTILLTPMDGTDTNNAKWFLGLSTHDFADDSEGKVTTFGKVRGIDTTGALSFGGLETWSSGDILYVDPVNTGYLTNVAPEPPSVYMPVALLLKKDATEGVVHVRATSIDETILRTTRMSLDSYSAEPSRNAQEQIHGNLDPIATAQDPNAGVVTLTANATYGQGKMVIANNGVAETGVVTITGTSVDRDTGVETPLDTEVITIDITTTDSNHLDGNSQQVWDLENAFITSKWWTGSANITITQDSGSLTDLDIYQIAFDQFGDARSIRLRILDMTLQAINSTDGQLSGHAYVVQVTGQRVNVQQIPDTELDINGGFVVDKWYRYKRQNFDIQLDGRTDGFFFGMSFLGSPPKFANVTLKVWADIIP